MPDVQERALVRSQELSAATTRQTASADGSATDSWVAARTTANMRNICLDEGRGLTRCGIAISSSTNTTTNPGAYDCGACTAVTLRKRAVSVTDADARNFLLVAAERLEREARRMEKS